MSTYDLRQSDTGVFYVHWTEGRRSRRVSTRSKDLASAKSFLATWLTLETEGAPEAALTCAEAWAAYWSGHFLKKKLPKSIKSAEYAWQNLDRHFGPLSVRAVSQAVVDDYVAARLAGRVGRPSQEQTAARELTLLRASLSWCARKKLISRDDVPNFDSPGPGPVRDRWLTKDELVKVFAAAEQMRMERRGRAASVLSRTERFLWLAHHTAARKSAILELTWDRVDFETGVIDYNVPGRVVTSKRRVAVPIGPDLLPVLKRAYRERSNNLVMTTGSDIVESLSRLAARAGVGHLHPHLFRHTAATHMARAGVDLWSVSGVLGDSMATVTKNYLKHCPEHLRKAVVQLGLSAGQQAEKLGATLCAAPKMGAEIDLQKPTSVGSEQEEEPVN